MHICVFKRHCTPVIAQRGQNNLPVVVAQSEKRVRFTKLRVGVIDRQAQHRLRTNSMKLSPVMCKCEVQNINWSE